MERNAKLDVFGALIVLNLCAHGVADTFTGVEKMAKVRVRRLWLNVRFDVPKNVPRDEIIETLIESIERGDYKLPRGWRVVLEWRNKANAPMKRGEWRSELEASAESSDGFDKAVIAWLESKL